MCYHTDMLNSTTNDQTSRTPCCHCCGEPAIDEMENGYCPDCADEVRCLIMEEAANAERDPDMFGGDQYGDEYPDW